MSARQTGKSTLVQSEPFFDDRLYLTLDDLGVRERARMSPDDLVRSAERILRDKETEEDLQLILAPGSSLGGARPKASVIDQHGDLSIAKFPKETDDYCLETWRKLRCIWPARRASPRPRMI